MLQETEWVDSFPFKTSSSLAPLRSGIPARTRVPFESIQFVTAIGNFFAGIRGSLLKPGAHEMVEERKRPMKTRLSFLRAACVLLAGLFFTQHGKAFETVVLDAGHGGNDEGTRWYHVSEEDLTLQVSKRVAALLREKGIHVVETRVDDRYVSLGDRAAVANRHRNSLLVSIHFNSSRTTSISGFQTYHFFASPSGKVIADSIQLSLGEKLTTPNRGVMKNDFAVLTRTSDCAVLVECGFISNKKEAMYFNSLEGQKVLAEALTAGILRVKPVTNTDPPECVEAKAAVIAKRAAAAERRMLLSGRLNKNHDEDAEPEHGSVALELAMTGTVGSSFSSFRGMLGYQMPSTLMLTPTFNGMLRDILAAYAYENRGGK
jgi:N-acetylmuramoyl-L-alanine amidase